MSNDKSNKRKGTKLQDEEIRKEQKMNFEEKSKKDNNIKEESSQSEKVKKNKRDSSEKKDENSTILSALLNKSNSEVRKWVEVDEEGVSGKFSLDEIKILKEAVCNYVFEKGIGQKGLIQLISEKAQKETFGAWTTIAECLPNRSVQSCHNLCRRRFNPNNYKGKWTESEVEQLRILVQQHGRKWKLISEHLERTETNVRDKFRQIGEENSDKRVNFWCIKELVRLVKSIQKATGVKLLNNKKEMKAQIKEQGKTLDSESYEQSLKVQRVRNLSNIDNNTRFLLNYVNFDGFKIIGTEKIPWTAIAERIKQKSKDDCKNKWTQNILRIVFAFKSGEDREEDEDLIEKINRQNPKSEECINFEDIAILNGKSALENKMRWLSLRKKINLQTTVPAGLLQLVENFKNSKPNSQAKVENSQSQKIEKPQKEILSYYQKNFK